MEGTRTPTLLRFGSFEVNLSTGELRHEGLRVRLPDQSFHILAMLLERPGELILREAIQKQLWPNDTVVEFESSINAAVRRLRLALGDSAETPRFIETLARRGYRFIGQIQADDTSESVAAPEPPPNAIVQGDALTEALTESPFSQGRKVAGRYYIEEFLGRGAFGEVYRAYDELLSRPVALKTFEFDNDDSPRRIETVLAEARTIAKLDHDNIVSIHDAGHEGNAAWIVMRLVEGEGLNRVLAREGKLERQRAAGLLRQISKALDHAHRKGIIHRDVKPSNILIEKRNDGSEHAWLADFGIAQVLARAPLKEGLVAGTPSYMSPEQITGKPVDARTDVFALGCVAYELITGERAFPSETPTEMKHHVIHDQPELMSQLTSLAGEKFSSVCRRALAKSPGDRYQTVEELLRELEGDEGDERARVASGLLAKIFRTQEPARWDAILAAIALTLVVIGVGLYKFVARKESPAPFQAMKLTTLTTTGNVRQGVVSPDGKYLAYVASEAAGQSLRVRQIATGSSVQIVPTADASYTGLTFSPDGNYVYYVRTENKEPSLGMLYQVPVLGGASRKLVVDVDSPVTFSPDGQRLAFVREYSNQQESALMVANVDGTGERRLATRKLPSEFGTSGPAWSPDGKSVAVGCGEAVVAVQVADGKQETLASKLRGDVGRVAWLADGSGLLMIAFDDAPRQQIWHLAYPSGRVHRITNDTNDYDDTSLTGDSKTIVAVSGKLATRIWVFPKGKPDRRRQLNPGTGKWDGLFGFSWTPEGKIVYTSEASRGVDLWIMDADGTNPKELTFAGNVAGTSVCRDGRYIVFSVFSSGFLWRMDIDGGNPKQLTNEKAAFSPQCSPDGKWVVYQLWRSGTSTIWKVPIDGGVSAQITEEPCYWPAISPDGKWTACVLSKDSGRQLKLAVLPFMGGPPTKTFDISGGGPLDWTPDGKSVTFIAGKQVSADIWIQSLLGGAPRRMTDIQAPFMSYHAWSPDGKQLALVYGRPTGDAVMISNFK